MGSSSISKKVSVNLHRRGGSSASDTLGVNFLFFYSLWNCAILHMFHFSYFSCKCNTNELIITEILNSLFNLLFLTSYFCQPFLNVHKHVKMIRVSTVQVHDGGSGLRLNDALT